MEIMILGPKTKSLIRMTSIHFNLVWFEDFLMILILETELNMAGEDHWAPKTLVVLNGRNRKIKSLTYLFFPHHRFANILVFKEIQKLKKLVAL